MWHTPQAEQGCQTPAEVLQLKDLSDLLSTTKCAGVEGAKQLQRFCRCLQEPQALAASFRCGRGLPDFAAITTVISSLISFDTSTGPDSSSAVEAAERAEAIMEAISASLVGAAAERPHHVGNPEKSELQCQSKPDEDRDCIWILSLLAAALPLLADSLPQDDSGLCVLPHQHGMDLQNADDLCMPMRLWNGRRAYDTQKICDRCMEAILDREFYHCSRDCDVDFCRNCHAELQEVLDKHFTARSSTMPTAHLVERMLWTMHVTDELAWQIVHRTQHERMTLASALAEELPLGMFSDLVTAVVDVCNAKVLYNASNGAVTSSVSRSYMQQERYEQQSCPLYEDDCFWKTVGLLQFLYASNTLRKELPDCVQCEGEQRPSVSALSFVPEAINQCRPEVEWEHWSRRRETGALPNILASQNFTTESQEFRCLAAHANILPINFRRSCVVQDVRQCCCDAVGHAWQELLARRVIVGREPEILVADLEAFLCEETGEAKGKAQERADMDALQMMPREPEGSGRLQQQSNTETNEAEGRETATRATSAQLLRLPFHVAFRGEDGQGPGVRKEFFHARALLLVGVIRIACNPSIQSTSSKPFKLVCRLQRGHFSRFCLKKCAAASAHQLPKVLR